MCCLLVERSHVQACIFSHFSFMSYGHSSFFFFLGTRIYQFTQPDSFTFFFFMCVLVPWRVLGKREIRVYHYFLSLFIIIQLDKTRKMAEGFDFILLDCIILLAVSSVILLSVSSVIPLSVSSRQGSRFKIQGREIYIIREILCNLSRYPGICYFEEFGYCEIELSQHRLLHHPAIDIKNILLHEMIHAYLWIRHQNSNHG